MIYLLLADGFEEVEAICPLDILRRGGLSVQTVGITGKFVTGSHGITLEADILPEQAGDEIELLMFPGGMPGATNLDQSAHTDRLLNAVMHHGGRVAAICAAPMILGKRGLLQGKRAIAYPGYEKYLTGAIVTPDSRVVTDGPFTTAVGMGASAEFGFALLGLMAGREKAEEVFRSARFQ
ncbi:MAG: DJ-1 family glyoxalase III [Eubacteriales bacterium]